jgi:hypothetical protein
LGLAPPDLNGRWHGSGQSSYEVDGKSKAFVAALEIRQTFGRIVVEAFFEASSSSSRTPQAYLYQVESDWFLGFQYDNVPTQAREGTMQQHKGFAQLRILKERRIIAGRYFNDLGNQGELSVSYEGSVLHHRLQSN